MPLALDNIKLPTRQSNNISITSTRECLTDYYHRLTKLKSKIWLDKNVSVKLTYWSGREKVLEDTILKCYQSIQAFNIFLIHCATKWCTYIKCKIWVTQETITSYSGHLKKRLRPSVLVYNQRHSERTI